MTAQTSIDPFREMNRYDERDEDWPSSEVFEEPRRTLQNYWRKFHAVRDCGAGKVAYVEKTNSRPVDEKYEYSLRCWKCGHKVPEDEILFIGGEWFNNVGWLEYGDTTADLWLPEDRVLELGPDPDVAEYDAFDERWFRVLKPVLHIITVLGIFVLLTHAVNSGSVESGAGAVILSILYGKLAG